MRGWSCRQMCRCKTHDTVPRTTGWLVCDLRFARPRLGRRKGRLFLLYFIYHA